MQADFDLCLLQLHMILGSALNQPARIINYIYLHFFKQTFRGSLSSIHQPSHFSFCLFVLFDFISAWCTANILLLLSQIYESEVWAHIILCWVFFASSHVVCERKSLSPPASLMLTNTLYQQVYKYRPNGSLLALYIPGVVIRPIADVFRHFLM